MNRIFSAARPSLIAASRSRIPSSSPSLLLNQVRLAHGHEQESFGDFSKRYVAFFDTATDLFELQRGLNNCFAYDLVPGVDVIESALKAARRLDDFSTAVRILEGVKEKVENKKQYESYLEELKGVRSELGINTVEELFTQ